MGRISWKIALTHATVIFGVLLGQVDSALAQLRPIADDTLGEARSVAVPSDPENPVDRIDGGARRGDNLFHSFQEFHVDQGRGVYFTDPGVKNILGRVTGGIESQILGVLGVLGDANLFLINPSGIIFGENAQLSITGSFTATTADAIQFGEQGEFSASDAAAPPLLTVQPSAFLFNQMEPASIVNNSRTLPPVGLDSAPGGGLRVADGERITLLGGDVRIDGGGLSALGGRVEVGGISEPGAVVFNADGSLGFPADVARSDVSVDNSSRLVASDFTISGGSVSVTARALEIANGSGVSAGTVGEAEFVEGQAGDITLDASSIRIMNSTVDNVVRGGSSNGGNVLITADDLSISGGIIQSTLLGDGNAGKLKFDVRNRTTIDNNSLIFSNLGGADRAVIATGSGGNIEITTPVLLLTNGSLLQSGTFGQGRAGNVTISAPESVTLENSSILSNVFTNSFGNTATGGGGNIQITTPSLSLTRGAQLSSRTTGQGDGGDIRILSSSLSLTEKSRFSTSSLGQGNAGNVSIESRERAVFDRSYVFSNLSQLSANTTPVDSANDVRNAGNIQIAAGSLDLINGAQLQSFTRGPGNAGSITVQARDRISIEGVDPANSAAFSGIYAFTRANAQGRGGDVNLTADSVLVADNGRVSTDTDNSFPGGNIQITTPSLSLTRGARLSSRTTGQGDGGDIRILSGSLSLTEKSRFSTSSLGQGSAGNVSIENRERAVFDRSYIFSSLSQLSANTTPVDSANDVRNAGNIQIAAGSLDLINGAQLQSFTRGSGNAGSITVQARDRISIEGVDPANSVTPSAIYAFTRANAQGRGGDVNLTADSVLVADNGRVSTDTDNSFPGGNVTVKANTLELTGGGRLITSANGSGRAGDINLDITGQTILAGANTFEINNTPSFFSGLFASTARNSAGGGGTVRISTAELQVLDQARVEVDSQGSGTAGDLAIAAETVRLDNGRLTAENAAVNGGNITLSNTDVLLLRNGSLISTTAGTDSAGGNGGNINIDANAIVSVPNENSDIRANAFSGQGGNVRINSQGLFGIAAQPQTNPITSDITASSTQGVQGTVDIVTPEADVRNGLTELPVAFTDASNQITQTCSGNRDGAQSEFVVTGRGGLPSSPINPLVGDESLTDWGTTDWATLEESPDRLTEGQRRMSSSRPDFSEATEIVEAQGWKKDRNGTVELLPAAAIRTASASVSCQ